MLRIGFIGIGAMGWPMASNLARGGHPVTVYDGNAAARERFVHERRGRSAATLADLAADADIVITMLPTGPIVRQVFLEDEGGALAHSLRPGTVVIDMSSSEPLGTRDLAATLSTRGVSLIDAPVSGRVEGAERGELVMMIGADDQAALARVRPVLGLLGKKQFLVGPTGAGHAMKALNNFMAGTGFLAVIEALVVGRRFGLDPDVMIDVINESTGRNFHSANVMQQDVISRRFGTRFLLGLMAKDVKIAADLADDLGAQAPLATVSRELFQRVLQALGGDADHSEAAKYWEALNGVTLERPPQRERNF
jgi:3-hydroxyisobutyrate dehydrogenase